MLYEIAIEVLDDKINLDITSDPDRQKIISAQYVGPNRFAFAATTSSEFIHKQLQKEWKAVQPK